MILFLLLLVCRLLSVKYGSTMTSEVLVGLGLGALTINRFIDSLMKRIILVTSCWFLPEPAPPLALWGWWHHFLVPLSGIVLCHLVKGENKQSTTSSDVSLVYFHFQRNVDDVIAPLLPLYWHLPPGAAQSLNTDQRQRMKMDNDKIKSSGSPPGGCRYTLTPTVRNHSLYSL